MPQQQVADIADTQRFGLLLKHANTCAWCGADLPRDVAFQEHHMAKVHGLKC